MTTKRAPMILLNLFLFVSLAGCQITAGTIVAPTEAPTATAVPPSPTPTEPPLAAKVNGEYLLLTEFQSELQRLQAAEKELGIQSTEAEQRQKVLDELIGQMLLAQAAAQAGFTVDDITLQAHIEKIAAQLGGAQELEKWIAENGYDTASFRAALRRAIMAAWQRDQIANSIPTEMEQIHARQILLLDEALANKVYQQLQSGADFATLAQQYDPLLGGDLGWFPRGYLTQPVVEEAVFQLQPGQYTPVIKSAIGFHIVLVLERTVKPLEQDARRMIQRQAVQDWVNKKRENSTIEIRIGGG
jgi:peptidyl-prolyl cis-trans isomerase C